MLSNGAFALAMAIMAAAVLATRLAGAALMTRFTPSARVDRFLEGLSVSVIAALVASQLTVADARHVAAVIVAVAVMLLARSVVWAMFAGMVAAAAYPLIAPL